MTAIVDTKAPRDAARVLQALAAGRHPGRVEAILLAVDPAKATQIRNELARL